MTEEELDRIEQFVWNVVTPCLSETDGTDLGQLRLNVRDAIVAASASSRLMEAPASGDTAHDLIVRVRVLGDGPTREDRMAIVNAINAGTNPDCVAIISTVWDKRNDD